MRILRLEVQVTKFKKYKSYDPKIWLFIVIDLSNPKNYYVRDPRLYSLVKALYLVAQRLLVPKIKSVNRGPL